jgi:ubiquinone/menaquinone biosynthesis C-methylase UbiE
VLVERRARCVSDLPARAVSGSVLASRLGSRIMSRGDLVAQRAFKIQSGDARALAAATRPGPGFRCPVCQGELEREEDGLACVACGQRFPVRAGVPIFARGDDFYEEYLDEHCPYVRHPSRLKRLALRVLPYRAWREWKFYQRQLPRGLSLLDIGCARGKEWFADGAAFIAGVDPCFPPLVECAEHYDIVAQAGITELPFGDESFDCVLTSHVIGHIPMDEKDAAFSEIARVLKPGGLSINVIETDSKNAFVSFGKTDPELYRRNFVGTDGHVGLELPSAVLERFRHHGFEIRAVKKMESGAVYLRYYWKLLRNGYADRSRSVQRRIRLWETIERHRPLLMFYDLVMGIYNSFIEPWRTPIDHAMFIAVVAVKGAPARQAARRPASVQS